MSETHKMLFLPDTMAAWPWPRRINPHYEEVKAASNAWFQSFRAFNAESQRTFDKCDLCRLAALAYPGLGKEHLRTGCDLMNLIFVIDEYTDVENAAVCRDMVDVVIDTLNNPHKPRPEGEVILGEIARQFWARAIATASLTWQRHFLECFTDYLNSVVAQAAIRDQNAVLTIEEYLKNRRQNIAAHPSYVIMELPLDLPDEVLSHSVIVELSTYATDLLILDNDIASYNKEQSVGDDRHNILTIAMHQFNVEIDAAMSWVAQYHREVENAFIDGLKRVPSWGPEIDKPLDEYVLGLANCARANDCWNFESGRYFGSKGPEIQKSRLVPLLPKVERIPGLHRERVMVPLVDL